MLSPLRSRLTSDEKLDHVQEPVCCAMEYRGQYHANRMARPRVLQVSPSETRRNFLRRMTRPPRRRCASKDAMGDG